MTLALYLHPLASFCHKVLIALYENGVPFEARIVDLMDDAASARFMEMWPVGKIPVLRDEGRDRTIPESTIIIEYLEQHYSGSHPLLPPDKEARLEARLWGPFLRSLCQRSDAEDRHRSHSSRGGERPPRCG
jgi:glutathione S-transferase